jgi:hypothetical protein
MPPGNFVFTESPFPNWKGFKEGWILVLTMVKAIQTASRVLEGNPNCWDRNSLGHELKVIWYGMVWENTHTSSRNAREIALWLGHDTHTTVFGWKTCWYKLDWRTRHGWLLVFESAKATTESFPEIYDRMRWLRDEFHKASA